MLRQEYRARRDWLSLQPEGAVDSYHFLCVVSQALPFPQVGGLDFPPVWVPVRLTRWLETEPSSPLPSLAVKVQTHELDSLDVFTWVQQTGPRRPVKLLTDQLKGHVRTVCP